MFTSFLSSFSKSIVDSFKMFIAFVFMLVSISFYCGAILLWACVCIITFNEALGNDLIVLVPALGVYAFLFFWSITVFISWASEAHDYIEDNYIF